MIGNTQKMSDKIQSDRIVIDGFDFHHGSKVAAPFALPHCSPINGAVFRQVDKKTAQFLTNLPFFRHVLRRGFLGARMGENTRKHYEICNIFIEAILHLLSKISGPRDARRWIGLAKMAPQRHILDRVTSRIFIRTQLNFGDFSHAVTRSR